MVAARVSSVSSRTLHGCVVNIDDYRDQRLKIHDYKPELTAQTTGQKHAGGRPPQKVLPGPGLRVGDFSWGKWAEYLSPADMRAYSALRTAALTTQCLGWRLFAAAVGIEGRPAGKERLLPFFRLLEELDLIDIAEPGKLIPRVVIVNPLPDRVSREAIIKLTSRKLRLQGPPSAVVDAFLQSFAERYIRKTGHAYPFKAYHRRNAVSLLTACKGSLDRLKHLMDYYFWYMEPPHALGDLVRRLPVVMEECAELDDAKGPPYTEEQWAAIDAKQKAEVAFTSALNADADDATLERLGLQEKITDEKCRAVFHLDR